MDVGKKMYGTGLKLDIAAKYLAGDSSMSELAKQEHIVFFVSAVILISNPDPAANLPLFQCSQL